MCSFNEASKFSGGIPLDLICQSTTDDGRFQVVLVTEAFSPKRKSVRWCEKEPFRLTVIVLVQGVPDENARDTEYIQAVGPASSRIVNANSMPEKSNSGSTDAIATPS